MNYGENRVVVPMFGVIILLRALLGPSVFVKLAFSIEFLFDLSFKTRERIGSAFGQLVTRNSALTAIAVFVVLTLLFGSIIACDWIGVLFAAAIFAGGIYGSFAACMHQLPIRPWMSKY